MLAVPPNNLPTITITEVMYDAPGADTGHEWVEFQNSDSNPVSTLGWKFFEGGVNHKLIAQRLPAQAGSAMLAAGEYAVIANDAKKFSAGNPSYAGALFQSSFSLSNSGETIALKDASSTELASATYASSAGAQGDGNTLNVVNGAWVARSPSPGAPVSSATITPPASPTSSKSSSAKAGSKGNSSASRPVSLSGSAATDLSAQAGAATGNASFGILPWIFGLLAVILAGVGALFMLPKKKPEDEYKIIEDT